MKDKMSPYEHIKWFIVNCTILGLLPLMRNGKFKPNRIFISLHIILVCVFTAVYISLSMNLASVSAIYNDAKSKLILVIFINMFILHFVFVTHLLKIKQLQQLFDSLHQFDSYLGRQDKSVMGNANLWFLLASGGTTILILLSAILYVLRGSATFILAIDLTSKCLYNVIIHFIIITLYLIKLRIEKVNSVTEDIDNVPKIDYVESVIKMADCVFDSIDNFNSIFGWTLLLMYLHIIIYILRIMHVVITIFEVNQWLRILQLFINGVQPFIQGVVVATMCEKVVDEGKRTITLSYKALYRYSNVPTMREKLFILAQQASARCPQFSAAGFFSVDFSMLFTFVNLITTYVIVIIQFSQGNNGHNGQQGAVLQIVIIATMLAEDILVFLRATAILGVMPFYHRDKKEFKTIAVIPVVLSTVTVSAMVSETIYTIMSNAGVNMIVNISKPIVDVCMNVQMMITLNFLRPKSIKSLFDLFDEIDQDFQKLHKIQVSRIRFALLSFVLINVVFFGMNIMTMFLYGNKHPVMQYVLHYCGDTFSCYNINFIEFLKLLIVYSILQRFRLYNNMTIGMDSEEIFVGQRKVEQYLKMHRKLCDLVDGFNHIYGGNILLSIIQTIVYILRMCSMYVEGTGSTYVYLLTMWTIYSTIQIIVFASMCERVSDEGKKCVRLGYKALQRYNNVPAMREKLLILAQQSTARCPQFTAAGFFNVGYSMLFTFVNLITTYVIVSVQFSSSGKS